jgi:hypothetical protein
MTIMDEFAEIEKSARKLSDMIDAEEGTEWRTRHLEVNCECHESNH